MKKNDWWGGWGGGVGGGLRGRIGERGRGEPRFLKSEEPATDQTMMIAKIDHLLLFGLLFLQASCCVSTSNKDIFANEGGGGVLRGGTLKG